MMHNSAHDAKLQASPEARPRAGWPAEPTILERVAGIYREIGWPAEVTGDGFTAPYSAPSAGPPPWHLYRFTFHTVVGLSTTEPNGATRWQFGQ